MKKCVVSLVLVLLLLLPCLSLAAGFSSDADAIDQAAKSVVLLAIFDKEDNLVSQGSGFVAFDNQTLVTNYHVIEDAYDIVAVSDNDVSYMVSEVLCADKELDIAILRFLEPTDLAPLTLFADQALKRIAPVVAIGSPEGLRNTVSTGIISGLYGIGEEPSIQISAPISHGSSGGPLFNDDGYVIGVTSSTYAIEEGQNINFAIHAAIVKAMYNGWDGKTAYPLGKQPQTASLDYSGVYGPVAPAAPATSETAIPDAWECSHCGQKNTTNFCLSCGAAKPTWTCQCGSVNLTKFCGFCGSSVDQLLTDANAAIDCVAEGDFAQAIHLLSALGSFNSDSYETKQGTGFLAADCLARCYLDEATVLFGQGGQDEEVLSLLEKAAVSPHDADGVNEIKYQVACRYLAAGDWEKAGSVFTALGPYSDSATKVLECRYQQGIQAMDRKEYDSAVSFFQNAGAFSDAAAQISACYYAMGLEALAAQDFERAVTCLTAAGDYPDAKAKLEEAQATGTVSFYNTGLQQMAAGQYNEAIASFTAAGSYSDAETKLKECYYQSGLSLFARESWDAAKDRFESAGDYADAQDYFIRALHSQARKRMADKKYDGALQVLLPYVSDPSTLDLYVALAYEAGDLRLATHNYSYALKFYDQAAQFVDASEKKNACANAHIAYLLQNQNVAGAATAYADYVSGGLSPEDLAVYEPGVPGGNFRKYLLMAQGCGCLESVPKNETEYKAKYATAIKKLEKHFGLEEDGVLHLSELDSLSSFICPGDSSLSVATVLKKLADLGHITKNAVGLGNTYNEEYITAVKKAEKKLGLTADGCLTPEEYKAIVDQPSPEIKSFKIKATAAKGQVKITWTAVKNALWYDIYRDGEKIGTATKSPYTDPSPVINETNAYTVCARSYSSSASASQEVFVDPYYTSLDFDPFFENKEAYLGGYYKFNVSKPTEKIQKGDDLYLQFKKGSNYIWLRISDFFACEWEKINLDSYSDRVTKITVKECQYIGETAVLGLKYRTQPVFEVTAATWEHR